MTDERYSEEVLKAQDGKKVPLTSGPGGSVVGEATLKYNPDTGNLEARFRIPKRHLTDPRVAAWLKEAAREAIFRKES